MKAQHARLGRPPMSAVRSQLPATTVPATVHDAVVKEASRLGVTPTQVVRDAVISHLNSRRSIQSVHNQD